MKLFWFSVPRVWFRSVWLKTTPAISPTRCVDDIITSQCSPSLVNAEVRLVLLLTFAQVGMHYYTNRVLLAVKPHKPRNLCHKTELCVTFLKYNFAFQWVCSVILHHRSLSVLRQQGRSFLTTKIHNQGLFEPMSSHILFFYTHFVLFFFAAMKKVLAISGRLLGWGA